MKKEKIIEILENFKPDSGYCCRSSYEEFANERVNSRLDDIIEFIKREPDNEWIKCSERFPKQKSVNGKMVSDCVLVYTSDDDIRKAIYCDNEWLYFAFGAYALPLSVDVIYWRSLPEPPKGENKELL